MDNKLRCLERQKLSQQLTRVFYRKEVLDNAGQNKADGGAN